MNLINRDTDYAIRALRRMAAMPDKVFSTTDLHPELRVPRPYLRRILQTLARCGILRSLRGKGGGFMLNRPPNKIPLTDVIRAFQGEPRLIHCVLHGKLCPDSRTCPLRQTLREIETMALNKLRKTTIATLR